MLIVFLRRTAFLAVLFTVALSVILVSSLWDNVLLDIVFLVVAAFLLVLPAAKMLMNAEDGIPLFQNVWRP